ncbi:cell volume regulation protein A [Rheinheimera pacifica]|uniref:Cell volume regulation protein A n=1 Tax=Rheinheimera pacifica TaxID=173990 RepID=A0A1H6M5I3_9GAMM|nr:potassium/proton antiporter [Rheinheimera pacifica]SEH96581.1 cell volume regulation protein A [Rheinheimera pacifica]
MDGINLAILIGGFLFVISIIATLISARLGAPMLLVFLIIGMLAGEQGLVGIKFDNPQVAFLIGSIALVIILFDGGMRTHPERFRVALAPASMLATLGVVLTCGIVGVSAAYLLDMTLLQGLLLGAILSSTDAAAVFSIFQSQGLRIKDRVASTLEIESGSNDPMAVILTLTLVGVLVEGKTFSWDVGATFLQQAVVGGVMGYTAGRIFVFLCRKLPLSFAFFPLLAVASCIFIYAVTNTFGGSGFLAVYLMGYLVGNARLPQIIHILRMHDGLAWISQIGMFLMLGLLVVPSNLMNHLVPALLLAAVLIFIARPIAVFLSLIPFRFPARDQLFISWVGLRGAVPIILALFPWLAGMPDEHLYFDVAFVVVIVSLVVQGWSIVPVARWLKLEVPAELTPDQVMPLDAVPSNDVMEVLAFKVTDNSPVLASSWPDLQFKQPVQFLGVVRNGEWILPAKQPVFNAKDTIMVLTKLKHARQISEVLAKDAEKSVISQSSFFGDFVLNGNISLSDLDAFYTINFEDQDKQQTLAGYITQRFHRRVVIGDQVQLDKLLLTVRQVNDAGEATQVGIKPVAD